MKVNLKLRLNIFFNKGPFCAIFIRLLWLESIKYICHKFVDYWIGLANNS